MRRRRNVPIALMLKVEAIVEAVVAAIVSAVVTSELCVIGTDGSNPRTPAQWITRSRSWMLYSCPKSWSAFVMSRV